VATVLGEAAGIEQVGQVLAHGAATGRVPPRHRLGPGGIAEAPVALGQRGQLGMRRRRCRGRLQHGSIHAPTLRRRPLDLSS
jgi:hypothetical protein